MSYERITVERAGEVVTLTLANPEKRNVLALETMQEITAALHAVGETDALGVIIAAEGPVFSAGHNFGDMLGSSEAEVRALFDVCTEMMTLIQALPQVVIARVHALATAAGCQLVSMCDLAVAAESAAFADFDEASEGRVRDLAVGMEKGRLGRQAGHDLWVPVRTRRGSGAPGSCRKSSPSQ